MKYVVAGLGNPGSEYENTRHNTGRIVVEILSRMWRALEWEEKKKFKAYLTEGEVEGKDVLFVLPNAFMNNSGSVLKKFVTSVKKAEKLIVIYDDIDLPLGRFKISKGRGDGGHNGISSIAKHLQTKEFIRIRVGVSPKVRGSNEARKPKGEKKVLDFLMSDFRKAEQVSIEVLTKDIKLAVETIVRDGLDMAMNTHNQKD